jgi:chorismate lyase/3-hydroxybenzoate synthase
MTVPAPNRGSASRLLVCSGPISAGGVAAPAGSLGGLVFGAAASAPCMPDASPWFAVHSPVLGGAGALVYEAWLARGDGPTAHATHGSVRIGWSDSWAFAGMQIDASDPARPLRDATAFAYRALFDALDASGFSHPPRFWNYLPAIDGHEAGLERYRQFNIGRHQAFLAARRVPDAAPPAACALGHCGQALTVAGLAARTAPLALENPRQVSAYRYPQQYGPRRPAFSRACLLPSAATAVLLISGTASIVGHETRHAGDLAAQIDESIVNVDALIGVANARLQRRGFEPARMT